MLATHTIDPEDLFTITAGGFSATADAFARDDKTEGLWFVSMVGSQTALKAIWASLLKQPPDTAHIIRGADGMALSGGYQQCHIPYETIGTWTTKIARLRGSGGWHALVYTKTAEFAYEKDSFLLLAQSEEEAPALHHRFLDKRSPLPLHRSWADWLWHRGLEEGEIVPLQSVGVSAYRCSPKAQEAAGRPLPGGCVRMAHPAGGGERWIGPSRRAKRNNKRSRASATAGPGRRFSPDGEDLPLLRARRLAAPAQLGPAPLLPARDGGGAARPLPHALPPQAAGGRLDAGAADDRRQPSRADNRLLYRLRREHRDAPGAVLPAQPGNRRGGRVAEKRTRRHRQ